MLKIKLTLIVIFCIVGISQLSAQKGVSSSSVSMNRNNQILLPDQVQIEEYVNYHDHNIPRPTYNNHVRLSMDYRMSPDETIILQVGLATKELLDLSDLPPVNVSLVIDRSGSMQSQGKINHVKDALKAFIKGLRPKDYVSIIAYDSRASIILKSTKVEKIEALESIISGIRANGSTNLNDGLTLGYKEVWANYNPKYTNKVILFTDGIANVGVTDIEDIVENSFVFNKKGIDVSTIGLGNNLNYQLLQQLAKKGRGSNHFVGEHREDIIKVFDDELQALLSSIGKEASVEIEYPEEFTIKKIYGHTSSIKAQSIVIPLEQLNNGQTQVILVEFNAHTYAKKRPLKATLRYKASCNEVHFLEEEIGVKLHENKRFNNGEVMKNYYIAKMASSLKQMAKESQANNYEEAYNVVNNCLNEINEVFNNVQDKDIKRIRSILVKRKEMIGNYKPRHY